MFQIQALPRSMFQPLYGKSESDLAAMGVVVQVSPSDRGMPCRVALRDARRGERVLLLNHEHQPAHSPYRARHAIYVIDGAEEAQLAPEELPAVFNGRVLAARAFSDSGMMLDAGLAEGPAIRGEIERLLADPTAAYVQIHNALPGCYAATAVRSK